MIPKLYAHPFSSYCQKALVAAYEKGAGFEFRLLSFDDPATGAEFAVLWPLQRMPVLKTDAGTLVESSVIIEWFDIHGPNASRLIPPDQQAALDVRMRDRIFDNYVMTPMQKIVFDRLRPEAVRDPHGVAEARALLDRAYGWLDGEMAARSWASGANFTLADCAAAPALHYADWVHPIEGFPHLTSYLARLRSRPSFARATDDARPYRHLFPGGAPVDRG